jgi:hypothetical protein|tara:strand:+ start:464 stop:874 length:411 start_codon:yes stop_codon:yes gene_type:complete
MADTITTKRLSNSLKTMLISNDAVTLDDANYQVLVDAVNIESYDRASIQVLSNDENGGLTCQVWGSLFDGAEATPVTNSKWVQIGDDIVVAASSGAMKAISTTALRFLAITVKATDGSSSTAITAGDCKVFLQGTI